MHRSVVLIGVPERLLLVDCLNHEFGLQLVIPAVQLPVVLGILLVECLHVVNALLLLDEVLK